MNLSSKEKYRSILYIIYLPRWVFRNYSEDNLHYILKTLFTLGCNQNCINHVCDEFGVCIKGCVDRYWGSTCDSVCTVNCKEPSCDRSTGQCVTCPSGFWGDTCTLLCSSFCYGGVCGRTNGSCTQGCTPGRFGVICDQICSSGCKNGTCNQQSGIVLMDANQTGQGIIVKVSIRGSL